MRTCTKEFLNFASRAGDGGSAIASVFIDTQVATIPSPPSKEGGVASRLRIQGYMFLLWFGWWLTHVSGVAGSPLLRRLGVQGSEYKVVCLIRP